MAKPNPQKNNLKIVMIAIPYQSANISRGITFTTKLAFELAISRFVNFSKMCEHFPTSSEKQ